MREGDCEVAFDNLTRQLYATDASIYQVVPAAVAFPRTAEEARAAIQGAKDAGMAVTPRGAGSGLVGGAIGDGLIVDCARHNRGISELNLETRTVRVGAGVVLDQLNDFLRPHGFAFGPDVATSSRATLGGMIANDSSGGRVPIYGTTADHVLSLELIMADGRVVHVGNGDGSLSQEHDRSAALVQARTAQIDEWMPPGMKKRWPGYGVERFLRRAPTLANILAGSEGTLAAIFSAEVKIVPLPRAKGMGVVFFPSVAEAMQATVELLETGCCGMAGAFGALESKYELSLQVAQPLVEQIAAQPRGATIVAPGTSCRHQIEHLTPARPRHMAELLADALA